MTPHYQDDLVTLYAGDCLDVLRDLPGGIIDAVVTDPPYGLEFMGKDWDAPWKGKPGREFNELEPGTLGGFTQLPNHSRVNNVKCAACERWKFSSNPCKCAQPDFPNARLDAMLTFQLWCQEWAAECLRVLKPGGHLLAFGGTRTWHRLACAMEDAGFEIRDSIAWMYGSGFPKSLDVSKAIDKAAGAERQVVRVVPRTGKDAGTYGAMAGHNVETSPATPDAARWQGWGTALKPAHEPIVVARKPLTGTVAANVLEHGTGALNIDGCRIGTEGSTLGAGPGPQGDVFGDGLNGARGRPVPGLGRWPANVVLDEHQAAELDSQSGVSTSGAAGCKGSSGFAQGYDGGYTVPYGDTGGASRFFYTAKAGTDERPRVDGVAHPTVKPVDLMQWLVRLVTPPGGTVLEPFAGSGTTAEACVIEGFRCIAIEREADYLPLIVQRLNKPIQPTINGL